MTQDAKKTPKTDSVMESAGSLHPELIVVRVKHSRDLERELTESRALCDELAAALEMSTKHLDGLYWSHGDDGDKIALSFARAALSKYREGTK